jgi:hypothetical protein
MKYICQLHRVFLIRVMLPPLTIYILLQIANQCSIFSITLSHTCLASYEGPQRKTKLHQRRKFATPQPRIPANPSILSKLATETNSNMAKFTLNSKHLENIRISIIDYIDDLGRPHKKSKSSATKGEKYKSLSPQRSQTANPTCCSRNHPTKGLHYNDKQKSRQPHQ